MSFLFSNPLDELVDRATSENLPVGTDDIVLNLDIADKVKAKEVTPKQATQSLKRRLNHKNPNVQILALKLTDTCVKNSGHHFVQEVASREFIDNLVSIARAPIGTNPDVRHKILASIQSWGLAFKSKADLRYVTDVYESLKREGVTFPPIERSESSAAMIETTTAPEWTDSDVCMRCRTQFTTFNRKHHCRNCGQTFCGQCSSKQIALAHLGIVQDVRVCDGCHAKLSSKSAPSTPTLPRHKTDSGVAYPNSDLARKEEDDLQKALALSLSTSKSSDSKRPAAKPRAEPKRQTRVEEDDDDLKAAIAASLQDLQVSDYSDDLSASRPSYDYRSPAGSSASVSHSSYPTAATAARDVSPTVNQPAYNPHELSAVELENIRLFSELVERTEADVIAHGLGALSNSQLQTLYGQIATMQPKLSRSLHETVNKYGQFYELHDQLSGAVREYDRLLQERLAVAGYRKTYAAPPVGAPSGYPSHGQSYDTAGQYTTPPQAQSASYAPGYAATTAAGGYYGAGAEYQSAGQPSQSHAPAGQAGPPAQPQYYDGGQYPQQANGAPQQYEQPQQPQTGQAQYANTYNQAAQSYQDASVSSQYLEHNGVAPSQGPYQEAPQQQIGQPAPYSTEHNSQQAYSEQAPESYYQVPPGAPAEQYQTPSANSALPSQDRSGANYTYDSQPQYQNVGGQQQQYAYAPPTQKEYAPTPHVSPPPPEPEAPLIEL
ncbi:hypothetical protein DFJ77DRAFT_333527 [Powellomyces hirtus]|nr:hypothetical protein DFJ77DRAFT_333527 [Powellomyces hirtus]